MKEVFSYNKDIEKTAYLNWRMEHRQPIHDMNMMAEGYFKSAIMLAKSLINDNQNTDADVVIFPMLFSVNHAIELYEKSICLSLNILLSEKPKIKKTHDIRDIWNTVKKKIKEYGFGEGREEDEFNSMIQALERYLDELSNKLISEKLEIKKTHDILDIWNTVKKKIEEYGFGEGREEDEFNSLIQALESYLYELSNKLISEKPEIKKIHDILDIWNTVKKKIEEYGFGEGREDDEFNSMIQALESYLNDIKSAYRNIDFSRYPLNNKNEYHFYLKTSKNITVDLKNFVDVFEDISDCLDSLASYYYNLVLEKWEKN